MEKKEQNTVAYKLESITLLQSNFKRAIVFNGEDTSKLSNETNIDIQHSDLNNNMFSVFLKYGYILKYEENVILDIDILYSAEFTKPSDASEINIENFVNVNAPSIIFPFIRETIASLTSKALLGAILIQPVNFVHLYKSKKEQSK